MASDGLLAVIDLIRSSPLSPDLATRRAAMDELATAVPLPGDVAVEALTADGVPCERLTPVGDGSAGAWVVYFHGGGYTAGSVVSHRPHAARLARSLPGGVLNVGYRLAPEHPFPAAVDDAVTAYRWLVHHEGVDPSRIALAGDSAGGGLTAATLLALRDAGDPLPAAGVLLSPWTDLTMTARSYETRAAVDPVIEHGSLSDQAAMYLAGTDPTHPLASPLHADLTGLPPLLVHVGDAECLLDDGVGFAERARAAGVDTTLEVTPEAIHCWHLFADFAPEGAEAMARVVEFLRTRLR